MIKYGYYSVPVFSETKQNSNRRGVVTVAIYRPDKNDPEQEHKASFAFCSPKDNFKKVLGRKIAENRLNSPKAKHKITVKFRGSVSQVIDKALEKAVTEGLVPTWVFKAYKKDNIHYGLRARNDSSV